MADHARWPRWLGQPVFGPRLRCVSRRLAAPWAVGRSTVDASVPAVADDQFWFAQFRMGDYPQFFKGVAFPQDAASLDQFFRQMTPNIGTFDANLIAGSLKALFDRIGDGVLVTRSQGGIVGWPAFKPPTTSSPSWRGIRAMMRFTR